MRELETLSHALQEALILWVACLHKRLSCHGCANELPEGHEEVPAADPAQVKERVRPGGKQEYAPEAVPAHQQITDLHSAYLLMAYNLTMQCQADCAERMCHTGITTLSL